MWELRRLFSLSSWVASSVGYIPALHNQQIVASLVHMLDVLVNFFLFKFALIINPKKKKKLYQHKIKKDDGGS